MQHTVPASIFAAAQVAEGAAFDVGAYPLGFATGGASPYPVQPLCPFT